jgi:hypothetical protein
LFLSISAVSSSRYKLKENVRESLYDYANQWADAVGTENKFRGGATPNLADLNLYGALRSFRGCHAFHDVMRHTKIRDWYDNIHKQVKLSKGKDKLNLYVSSKSNGKQSAAAATTATNVEKQKKRFYFF